MTPLTLIEAVSLAYEVQVNKNMEAYREAEAALKALKSPLTYEQLQVTQLITAAVKAGRETFKQFENENRN